MFGTSDFWLRASGSGPRVSSSGFLVPGFGLRVSGFGFDVSGSVITLLTFGAITDWVIHANTYHIYMYVYVGE